MFSNIIYNNWANTVSLYKQFLFFFLAFNAIFLKEQGIRAIKKGVICEVIKLIIESLRRVVCVFLYTAPKQDK